MALESIDGGQSDRESAPRAKTTTSFVIPNMWLDKVDEEAKRQRTSRTNVYMQAITQFFETFRAAGWETTDDDYYDPSSFYTRASDKQGHSHTLRVPLPKPLFGEMTQLVASGAVPQYRHTADLARDAIYHRIKTVAQMIEDGKLEQAADMAMLLSEEMQIQDEAEHAEQLIATVKANAHRMLQQGSTDILRKYLAQRHEKADTIPEPFRTEYLEVLEEFDKRIAKAKGTPKGQTRSPKATKTRRRR